MRGCRIKVDAHDLVENNPDLDGYHVEVVRRAYRVLLSASLAGFDGTLAEPFVRFELPDEVTVWGGENDE